LIYHCGLCTFVNNIFYALNVSRVFYAAKAHMLTEWVN